MVRLVCWFFALCVVADAYGYNEIYNTEIVENIDKFSAAIQKYVENGNRSISNDCQEQLELFRNGLKARDEWAMQMLDSIGKLPSGLLHGHQGDVGAFDECMDIEATNATNTIVGKYCMGFMALPTSKSERVHGVKDLREVPSRLYQPLYFGTCSPNKCTNLEIQGLYNSIGIPVGIGEALCQDKLNGLEIETADIVAIAFLGIILGIMIISTIYDSVLYYTNKKPANVLLISFSLLTNLNKILAPNKSKNQLLCLHGIRTLSLMWVIMGHRFSIFRRTYSTNWNAFDAWSHKSYNMFLMGAHSSVDTFLVLSGFLLCYTYMGAISRGVKFDLFKFYLHRFLRLTPALAVLVLVTVTIFKFFGAGPMWPYVSANLSGNCKEYWWSTLLYVQNYVNPLEFCMTHTWYLSVDTQLFVLSPLILIPMRKKPKLALVMLFVLLVLSVLTPFLITWFYEIKTLQLVNGVLFESEDFIVKFYNATHARAAPWLIGFALGYIVYKTKQTGIDKWKRKKYFKLLVFICWCVSLGTMYGCVFGWHDLIISNDHSQFEHSAQMSFTKPAWGIAVGWVIFACVHGYGGPINWFLSLSIFQFLSKISYSMYLLHSLPVVIQGFTIKRNITFGNFEVLYVYWGDVVYATILGMIWTLSFESPIIGIEKFLFHGGGGGPKVKKDDRKEAAPRRNDIEKGENVIHDKDSQIIGGAEVEKCEKNVEIKDNSQDSSTQDKGDVDCERKTSKNEQSDINDNEDKLKKY